MQGISEFLPISSSGHLVLMQTLLGINEPIIAFDVLLHAGTLVPVFIVYRRDIWSLIRNPFQKLTFLLIVGTIPAVLAALAFGDTVEAMFQGGILLAFGFFVTGVFLLYADRVQDGYKSAKDVTFVDALVIGLMQAIAITPAISRSGSTITGALARRLDRETAARFSFLLSIPAILGALVLQLVKILRGHDITGGIDPLPMLLGFAAAILSGYLSITFMIRLIRQSKLKYFSYYVFALGTFVLIYELIIK